MRSSKRRINGKGSFLFIRTRNIGILWLIPILLVLLTSGRPASALAQTEVSGPITENTTWEQGKTYTVTGNVTVQAGVTLTVEQGVEVRFNAKTHLEVKGRLQAEGNADEPILFTGTDASLGWWHGILIVEDGSADLEYVTVAYAGAISTGFSYNDKSIYKTGSGDLTLKNSTFRDGGGRAFNGGSGLYIQDNTGAITLENSVFSSNANSGLKLVNAGGVTATGCEFNGNTFYGVHQSANDTLTGFSGNTYADNQQGQVGIDGGTISGDVTWGLDANSSLYVTGHVIVDNEAQLTILPGTILKFGQGVSLQVNGHLAAQGTTALPIYFTDYRDDTVGGDTNNDDNATEAATGWWHGVLILEDGSADLEHVTLAYAGAISNYFPYNDKSIYKIGNGDLTVKNSTIRDGGGRADLSMGSGLHIENNTGTITLENSTFSKNVHAGLQMNNSTGDHVIERNTFTANLIGVDVSNQTEDVLLTANLIEGNTDFGVRNQSAADMTVDAPNNWWGHETGPKHDTNPLGEGDTVSDGVLFDPWRTTPSSGLILSPVRSGRLVAGDMLRFSGSVLDATDAVYSWDFSDDRSFAVREPGMVNFPETGTIAVSYSAVPKGADEPNPDTRSYDVVENTGDLPDLRVMNVTVPPSLAVGQPVQISYTVRNVGQGQTQTGSAWRDVVYLSRDAHLDIHDVLLGSTSVSLELDAGESYQGALNVTLPVIDEGAWHLILVVNDAWEVLELHSLNNESAAQVTARVPALEAGETSTVSYPVGRVEQYFRLTATEGQSMLLDLSHLPAGLEVFVRFGALPTRGEYDYRFLGGGRYVIPAAAAGNWYILVFGQMDEAGEYDILFDMVDMALTSSSPSRHGTDTDLELTLTGTGFYQPMVVELVSGETTYEADEVEVDSFTQTTATFSAGTIPAGTYTVRITRTGQTSELAEALEVVAGGQGELEVNLILPARLGYHILATIYVEYANTGDAAMPAPLLFVTASQEGRHAAIMTLDHHRLSSGFWTSAMPEGFSNAVQFLASGERAGVLLPGESRRVPVYYAGWQQPWDTTNYPPFEWAIGVLDANNETLADWDALKVEMQPDYIREDAWAVLWDNFTSQAGSTWGDYVTMLSRNASYLHRQGQRVEDVPSLLMFSLRQAEGFSPLNVLAGGFDASLQAPGYPLIFKRSYLNFLSRRFELGTLGRGWTHNWQIDLLRKDDGTIVVADGNGSLRIFQPDRRYNNRYISQPGDRGRLRLSNEGFLLTESNGNTILFNESGKIAYIQDRNGNKISCDYNGDMLATVKHSAGPYLNFDYNLDGFITSITDNHGRSTEYTYNGEYLNEVKFFNNRSVKYEYYTDNDTSQHAIKTIHLPDNSTMSYKYDKKGHLISMYRNDHKENISFSYPGAGVVEVADVFGKKSKIFYNHMGMTVKNVSPLDENIYITYDEIGRPISYTDSAGYSSILEYDANGNIVLFTDTIRNSLKYNYFQEYNLLSSFVDHAGNEYKYNYDSNGNLTTLTYPDNSIEIFSYDEFGNPVTWTNRRNRTINFAYNSSGFITEKKYADNSLFKYYYDEQNNLVRMESDKHETEFTYNEYNYLAKITYPGERFLEFVYDDSGRRISSEDHDGYRIEYNYNELGRLHKLTAFSDNISKDLVIYSYDALGRLDRKKMGNGVYTAHEYDDAGRLQKMLNYNQNDEILSSYEYGYDSRGRRASMKTHYGAWTYEYDNMGQLIGAILLSSDPEIDDQEIAYYYDALGNRTKTTLNGTTTSYSSNKLNQYTKIGDTTYSYDFDGNLIREEGPGGISEYIYNDENRLIGVIQGNDNWEYEHDGLGNRITRIENDVVTHFVIDPISFGNLVGEYDDNSIMQVRYTYGNGLVGRQTENSDISYYTFDPVGNTSEITGSDGLVQNFYTYLPFGEIFSSNETLNNPYQFMGKYGIMAEPLGFHVVRARNYVAHSGRFTSRDPIGILGGDENFYRYAYNSPIDYFDPYGYITMPSKKSLLQFTAGTIAIAVAVKTAPATMAAYGTYKLILWGSAGFTGLWQTTTGSIGIISEISGQGTPDFILKDTLLTFVVEEIVADEKLSIYYHEVLDIIDEYTSDDFEIPSSPQEVFVFIIDNYDICEDAAYQLAKLIYDKVYEVSAIMPVGDNDNVASWDPNQKLSVAGYGEGNFVRPDRLLTYRIDFENYEDATAPAQIVTIRDALSEHLDLDVLELGEIGFGNVQVQVPPGLQYYQTVVDYAYKDDDYDFLIEVHVEAWLENGMLHFNFLSIDPNTGMPPEDPNIGFLPPNDRDPETEEPLSGRGQGYVSYMVRPKADLPSGTEIRNIAEIQFDMNKIYRTDLEDPLDPDSDPDENKQALVTFDSLPPESSVNTLPAVTPTETFTVSWSGVDPGEDEEKGSGVGSYDIYVQDNGGEWATWLTGTAATSAEYSGEDGKSYAFYAMATDNVGNQEVKAAQAEATTKVEVPTAMHTVTASAGPNGNIEPEGDVDVADGQRQEFTVTPDEGYTASVRGTCGGALDGTTYTTEPITDDCTVAATFTIADPEAIPTLSQWGMAALTALLLLFGATVLRWRRTDFGRAA